MHIFLTNDDGYEAPGIVAMAKKLATLGRVTVIAPDKGRSSCSSSLSLQTYLRLWYKESYGENITVLACSGTTADCAKLALCHWLKSDMPDLIVSGINNGYNTGSDCIYSGPSAVRSRASSPGYRLSRSLRRRQRRRLFWKRHQTLPWMS